MRFLGWKRRRKGASLRLGPKSAFPQTQGSGKLAGVSPKLPASPPLPSLTAETPTASSLTAESCPETGFIQNGALAGQPCVGVIGRLADVKPSAYKGEYRPDFTVDRADVKDLVLGAVSLRGLSHQDFGKPRQDALAYRVTHDGRFIIAAIADGMSSAPLAHMGAERAVRLALKHAEGALSNLADDHPLSECDWADVEAQVRVGILDHAQTLERQGIFSVSGEATAMTYAKALGTTAEILVVKCASDSQGRHELVRVVLAGDGSGFIHDSSDGWTVLSLGKTNDAEIASNAIRPLPVESEGFPLVQPSFIQKGQAVLVVTDGIGDCGIGSDNQVSAFLHERLGKPLSAVELLTTFSFVQNFKDDDRTAVVIWATA